MINRNLSYIKILDNFFFLFVTLLPKRVTRNSLAESRAKLSILSSRGLPPRKFARRLAAVSGPPCCQNLKFLTPFVSKREVNNNFFLTAIDAEAVKKTRSAVAGGCHKEIVREQLSPAHKQSVFRPNITCRSFGTFAAKSTRKNYETI